MRATKDMPEEILVGEGVEILRYLAREGPQSTYKLESKWSSRTVAKQLKRLQLKIVGRPRALGESPLVEKTNGGYRVTDYGFFELIPHVKVSERREFIKKAIDAYPNGMADQSYRWMLAKDVRVRSPERLQSKLKAISFL